MGFKVTRAKWEHARDIAQIHVASWRTTYKGIVADETLAKLDIEARTQQWLGRLTEPEPGICTFVAADEAGRVVGFATGGPIRSKELNADGELYAIYLYKESQRKGIGKALFSQVARYLDQAGFNSVAVWVLELNPSRRFYEALGGERIAEKPISLDRMTLKEVGYYWPCIRTLLQRLTSHPL
jgi:GNAT superfamily N-acetyltransferase